MPAPRSVGGSTLEEVETLPCLVTGAPSNELAFPFLILSPVVDRASAAAILSLSRAAHSEDCVSSTVVVRYVSSNVVAAVVESTRRRLRVDPLPRRLRWLRVAVLYRLPSVAGCVVISPLDDARSELPGGLIVSLEFVAVSVRTPPGVSPLRGAVECSTLECRRRRVVGRYRTVSGCSESTSSSGSAGVLSAPSLQGHSVKEDVAFFGRAVRSGSLAYAPSLRIAATIIPVTSVVTMMATAGYTKALLQIDRPQGALFEFTDEELSLLVTPGYMVLLKLRSTLRPLRSTFRSALSRASMAAVLLLVLPMASHTASSKSRKPSLEELALAVPLLLEAASWGATGTCSSFHFARFLPLLLVFFMVPVMREVPPASPVVGTLLSRACLVRCPLLRRL